MGAAGRFRLLFALSAVVGAACTETLSPDEGTAWAASDPAAPAVLPSERSLVRSERLQSSGVHAHGVAPHREFSGPEPPQIEEDINPTAEEHLPVPAEPEKPIVLNGDDDLDPAAVSPAKSLDPLDEQKIAQIQDMSMLKHVLTDMNASMWELQEKFMDYQKQQIMRIKAVEEDFVSGQSRWQKMLDAKVTETYTAIEIGVQQMEAVDYAQQFYGYEGCFEYETAPRDWYRASGGHKKIPAGEGSVNTCRDWCRQLAKKSHFAQQAKKKKEEAIAALKALQQQLAEAQAMNEAKPESLNKTELQALNETRDKAEAEVMNETKANVTKVNQTEVQMKILQKIHAKIQAMKEKKIKELEKKLATAENKLDVHGKVEELQQGIFNVTNFAPPPPPPTEKVLPKTAWNGAVDEVRIGEILAQGTANSAMKEEPTKEAPPLPEETDTGDKANEESDNANKESTADDDPEKQQEEEVQHAFYRYAVLSCPKPQGRFQTMWTIPWNYVDCYCAELDPLQPEADGRVPHSKPDGDCAGWNPDFWGITMKSGAKQSAIKLPSPAVSVEVNPPREPQQTFGTDESGSMVEVDPFGGVGNLVKKFSSKVKGAVAKVAEARADFTAAEEAAKEKLKSVTVAGGEKAAKDEEPEMEKAKEEAEQKEAASEKAAKDEELETEKREAMDEVNKEDQDAGNAGEGADAEAKAAEKERQDVENEEARKSVGAEKKDKENSWVHLIGARGPDSQHWRREPTQPPEFCTGATAMDGGILGGGARAAVYGIGLSVHERQERLHPDLDPLHTLHRDVVFPSLPRQAPKDMDYYTLSPAGKGP